jgi:hypothetical protein
MMIKRKADAQKEALSAVESVCHEAFVLAVLFRGRKTRYLWEQDANPAQITAADLEIIGSLYEEAEATQAQVARVVFETDVEALNLGGSNDMDRLRRAVVCNSDLNLHFTHFINIDAP